VAGRGRERAEGSRRGLLQERTHGLRLTKYGVHNGRIDSFSSFGIVFFFLRGYIRGEGCCVEEVGGGRFLMSSTLPSEVWGGDGGSSASCWGQPSRQIIFNGSHSIGQCPGIINTPFQMK
jgi:hypothetical protein